MQSTIHSCLSGSDEVNEMVRDFIVGMMSEYRLDVDVGMETCAQ